MIKILMGNTCTFIVTWESHHLNVLIFEEHVVAVVEIRILAVKRFFDVISNDLRRNKSSFL